MGEPVARKIPNFVHGDVPVKGTIWPKAHQYIRVACDLLSRHDGPRDVLGHATLIRCDGEKVGIPGILHLLLSAHPNWRSE
jgi:hypothetical protein